jgi:thioesterase domain-containing protein
LLYREMAMQMQPGQPVFGLQCKGLDGRGGHHERIEDMARDYVAEIGRHYPTGPLIIGGYCMGGGVALEMARQFKEQGRPAKLVVMIESYNYIGCGVTETRLLRLYHSIQNIWFHLYNLIRAGRRGKGKGDFLRQKIQVEFSRVKAKLKLAWGHAARSLGFNTSEDYPHFRLSAVNDKAYFDYTPVTYDGAIAVIRPEQQFAGYDQHTCGWDKIARGPLDIHVLPVSPRGMLVAPFSTDLGAAVRKAVDNVINQPSA